MTVKLNRRAYAHARELVSVRRFVLDSRDDWSEHQPGTDAENRFIELHGYREYGRWHLGYDDLAGEETKRRYKFPFGDFKRLHRCAVIAAETRAGQYKYDDVERAAAKLLGMLEASS